MTTQERRARAIVLAKLRNLLDLVETNRITVETVRVDRPATPDDGRRVLTIAYRLRWGDSNEVDGLR